MVKAARITRELMRPNMMGMPAKTCWCGAYPSGLRRIVGEILGVVVLASAFGSQR